MRTKRRFYSVLLVVLVVLLGTTTIACDSKAKEKQAIIDYLDDMIPVMEKQTDLYNEWWGLFESRDLEYSEASTELKDFLDRLQNIYRDVQSSLPPSPLREIRRQWMKECQLGIQAISMAIQGIEEYDLGMFREADNLAFQANEVKTKYVEDLIDLLNEYNIDIEGIPKY